MAGKKQTNASKQTFQKQPIEKENSQLTEILKVFLPFLGTVVVALIGYFGIIYTTEAPMRATQRAATDIASASLTQGAAVAETAVSFTPTEILPVSPEPTKTQTQTPEPILTATPQLSLIFVKPKMADSEHWPTIIFNEYNNTLNKPDWLKYYASRPQQDYLWKFLWCERFQADLDKNLPKMVFQFLVNDVVVPESNFLSYQSPGTELDTGLRVDCQRWVTIIQGLEIGKTYTLSAIYIISETIYYDNIYARAPGEYRQDIILTVR